MTDLDKMMLLPCPWCGDPLASVSVIEGSTFRWRRVQGCCTDGPEVHHDTKSDDQQAAEVDSHRRAIEAWNTRAAPPGYVLVPVEPTTEMWRAARECGAYPSLGDQYRAMLAARPGVKP